MDHTDAGTLTLYIASSLDGYIAAEDGGVEWLDGVQEDDENDVSAESYGEFFSTVDCLIVGSKTYEQILGFGDWPYGEKPSYVLTSRDLSPANNSVEMHDRDVDELAEELKWRHEHVWLVGGAQLAQALLRSESVDEIRLSLIPVVLGSGISLFSDAGFQHRLDLLATTAYSNGIVELHYHVPS